MELQNLEDTQTTQAKINVKFVCVGDWEGLGEGRHSYQQIIQ